MSLEPRPILAALVSHAQVSGKYAKVNRHEPKSAPHGGSRLTMSVWFQRSLPLGTKSGLYQTSGLVEFWARIYKNMLSEPQDEIDPDMMDAAADYIRRVSADYTLGGTVKNVDLLGAHGPGLSSQAGYLTQDRVPFRVILITIPCVINDLWEQVP